MGNKAHQKGTADRLVMKRLTRMLANFAKTGYAFDTSSIKYNEIPENGEDVGLEIKKMFALFSDPTPELDETISSKWEPVTRDKRNYLEINDELEPGVNPGESSWLFWKPILESLQLGVKKQS